MIDSASLVLGGEGGEGAGGLVEVVVEPDAGGEGEEFGGDPGAQSVQGARPVAFEAEAVFERPEDRFDALADPGQRRSVVRLVLAGGAQDRRAEALLGRGLEVAAGVALVGDDPVRRRAGPRSNSRSATSRSFWSAEARIAARACRPGRRAGAGACPKTSGCGCGCSDARRPAPAPNAGRSRPSARIRPGWSPAARCRRSSPGSPARTSPSATRSCRPAATAASSSRAAGAAWGSGGTTASARRRGTRDPRRCP